MKITLKNCLKLNALPSQIFLFEAATKAAEGMGDQLGKKAAELKEAAQSKIEGLKAEAKAIVDDANQRSADADAAVDGLVQRGALELVQGAALLKDNAAKQADSVADVWNNALTVAGAQGKAAEALVNSGSVALDAQKMAYAQKVDSLGAEYAQKLQNLTNGSQDVKGAPTSVLPEAMANMTTPNVVAAPVQEIDFEADGDAPVEVKGIASRESFLKANPDLSKYVSKEGASKLTFTAPKGSAAEKFIKMADFVPHIATKGQANDKYYVTKNGGADQYVWDGSNFKTDDTGKVLGINSGDKVEIKLNTNPITAMANEAIKAEPVITAEDFKADYSDIDFPDLNQAPQQVAKN